LWISGHLVWDVKFPYVVYVLAFDRQAVAQALQKDWIGSGEEHLEKIVQVSFDIPPNK